MLPRKKWYTWTVLLTLVFLGKEYLSEIFQTLLAVPHFRKVAGKELKAEADVRRCSEESSLFYSLSPATLLKCSLWRRCFLGDFAKFLRAHFLQNSSGGCFCGSLQLYKNKTSPRVFLDFLKIFGTFFFSDALQEFSKSSQKYWRKNVC